MALEEVGGTDPRHCSNKARYMVALKVDKNFRVHNYSEAKKVAMASIEFEDYANVWWENVMVDRKENLLEPIDTWEDMKLEMRKRFIPGHYTCDLYNKLGNVPMRCNGT
jgi:hypothetical protein